MDDKPLACLIHRMKVAKVSHSVWNDIFSALSMNPGTGDRPVNQDPSLVELRLKREGQLISRQRK